MKKISVLLVAVLMCAVFSGCIIPVSSSSRSSSTSITEESAGEQENSSEAVAETTDSGALGDYHVTILDATKVIDSEGNQALIVNFEFTNNSNENVAFGYSLYDKAFQDGVQLDSAYLYDVDGYDSGLAYKEVQPGNTITVQSAYALTSETSPVQIDVSELISLSSAKLSKTFNLQ